MSSKLSKFMHLYRAWVNLQDAHIGLTRSRFGPNMEKTAELHDIAIQALGNLMKALDNEVRAAQAEIENDFK